MNDESVTVDCSLAVQAAKLQTVNCERNYWVSTVICCLISMLCREAECQVRPCL